VMLCCCGGAGAGAGGSVVVVGGCREAEALVLKTCDALRCWVKREGELG
jgi:hypothetical protein